jgi:HEAT repeat protein
MTQSSSAQAVRELSPEAQAVAAWFRHLARALRVFRLYRGNNPTVLSAQTSVAATLADLLAKHGSLRLRFSASEIRLGEEPIVRVTTRAPGAEHVPAVTDALPFLFYRDGIRKITLQASAPRAEVDALVQILRSVGSGADSQDDLVTLLWQANLSSVQLEAVPLEQTIYVSARPGGEETKGVSRKGQAYAWSPTGSEIRADLGQAVGTQGLHRDTFDDWPLPEETVDVPAAFERLLPAAEAALPGFLSAWDLENSTTWAEQAPVFVRGLLALDGSEDTRRALARSVVTWLVSTLQRVAWEEAHDALQLLNELDPTRALSADELAAALSGLDTQTIADRLDEGELADHNRFAAFVVALGAPAVGFCMDIMSRAEKARSRAATVTALCYLCPENPELLAPWLSDSRWYVVRNLVFVLGLIGGPAVAPLLQTVARHPDARVRRQLVQSLGALPPEERTPLLIQQFDTHDAQLLAAALNTLAREKDPEVMRSILGCIESPDFESRDEGSQRALFGALGEIADDRAVPALEALLHQGGWFARRTFQRVAVARTLRRIATPSAMAALEAGVRARNEAVRSACLEALALRNKP